MDENHVTNYGYKIIHQSWKNENIPVKHKEHFESWHDYHPCALHVLWTDEDNTSFVKNEYPNLLDVYNSLVLVIQKCDMVRLLYLHKYGGVYADLDYEAHTNIFKNIPKKFDILIVESPALINETMQNSLMISRNRKHMYWEKCIESIIEIIDFIADREGCYKNGWGGCKLLEHFHNPITKKATNLLFTQYITGPAILDKTLVRYLHENWNIKQLASDRFFNGNSIEGGVSTHHQANSWVNISKNTPELMLLSVSFILLLCVICVISTVFVCNQILKHKN